MEQISLPVWLYSPFGLQAFDDVSHRVLWSVSDAELDVNVHIFDDRLKSGLIDPNKWLDHPERLIVVSSVFRDSLIRGRVVLGVAEHHMVEQGAVRGQEPHSEL